MKLVDDEPDAGDDGEKVGIICVALKHDDAALVDGSTLADCMKCGDALWISPSGRDTWLWRNRRQLMTQILCCCCAGMHSDIALMNLYASGKGHTHVFDGFGRCRCGISRLVMRAEVQDHPFNDNTPFQR